MRPKLLNGPMWAWQKTLQSTLTAADILIPSKHQVGYIEEVHHLRTKVCKGISTKTRGSHHFAYFRA